MKICGYSKNEKGQVLLMVIITSTIALLIVTGVFMRVMKLTRQGVEMETHDAAFSAAEKYARQILDQLELGNTVSDTTLQQWVTNYDDLIAASRNEINNINGYSLEDGSSFEMVGEMTGSTTFKIGSGSWGDVRILFTSVVYSGGQYSVQKRIFKTCSNTDGDLTAVTCASALDVDTFTYTHQPGEVTVRMKPIGGKVSLNINSSANLFNEFSFTTREEGTLSEATLSVPVSKSMPSLFDHVLYNGKSQINK